MTGPTEKLRTLLITAIGHVATNRLGPEHVRGIDLHQPDYFVPVESVNYIDPGSRRAKELAQSAWPTVATSSAKLVLLNNAWSALSEWRDQIIRCSRRKHILLAEEDPDEWPPRLALSGIFSAVHYDQDSNSIAVGIRAADYFSGR